MKKKRTNFSAVTFVFQLKKKPFTTRCVYFDDAKAYEKNKKWEHVATIDPALWIEFFLNYPEYRQTSIESIQR